MAAPVRVPHIRVLVVEDREVDFAYVSLLLGATRLAVYELEWARSYEAGREALERRAHDVGLFDHELGAGTGLQLLREARAMGNLMPILLLTGHDEPHLDREASAAGAADFLSKADVTATELERAIRYALRHAEMLAEHVRATQELRQATRLIEGILSTLPVVVSSVDADGTILESRGRGLAEIGVKDGELVGTNVFTDHPSLARGIRHALEGRPANFVSEMVSGGRPRYFDHYFHPDGERGHGAIGFSVNITARVEIEAERDRQTQLLRAIMRTMPVIIGRLDAAGRVVEARGTGLVRCGIIPRRLVGQGLADLFPPAREAVQQALGGETSNFTLRSQRQAAEEWHAEFVVMPDSDHAGGVTFFGRDVTERRWLEHQLLTISDAEQQRIGADLHDGLGQQLTGLACIATALRDRLGPESPLAAQADLIAQLANDATKQSRALARGLCPVQLEQAGLESALEDLTYQAQLLHGVQCHFRARGPLPRPDHFTAMHLYRITQEALHNAVRHGDARTVAVALVSRGHRHRLIVKDDGRGFDLRASAAGGGRGLRLMSYRAGMIGGTFSVQTQPGRGTSILCRFTSPPTLS